MEPSVPTGPAGSTGSAGSPESSGATGASGSAPASPGPSPSSSVPASDSTTEAARSRDRLIGLVIVAIAFAVCLALSFWAKEKSEPETSEPPAPPTVQGVVGFPKAVDAVESLKAARGLTRRAVLRGIVMDGVSAEGLVDVSEPTSRVRYAFQSEPGDGPQPPREPGTLPKRLTCGRQNVVIRSGGMAAEIDQADYPCAPGTTLEPLPEPQCSAKVVWKLAKRRHIPGDKNARLEYYRSKAGPAWRFEIPGTQHRFSVYGDCKRELNGVEAVGSVP